MEAPQPVQTKPRTHGKEIALIGILALTIITAVIVIPRLQSNVSQQGQPISLSGYVLIGNKGTPYQVFFDNPTTGRYTASSYTTDKSYSVNLLTGYTYTVTLQYLDQSYNYVNCTPVPSTVSPSGQSGSTIRQDFTC